MTQDTADAPGRTARIGSRDIGIDLGTANTLVYACGHGIVLNEPSVVAVEQRSNTVIAVGAAAKETIGRTPGSIVAIRPLKDGVISDFDATEQMIRHFLNKALPGRRSRARMVVCVPSGVTPVERRAIEQASVQAGAKSVYLVEEPMAAAIGAGLPVAEPRGTMVVDLGGGTTEVAVISLGGIVTARSLRVGGDRMDAAVRDYVRREYGLLIGERTAEDIKVEVGSAWPDVEHIDLEDKVFTVRGREKAGGMPRTLQLTATDTRRALEELVLMIIAGVLETFEQCPPELAGDIAERGIVLTGGGALLPGLASRITDSTGIACRTADSPLDCVALGTGKCAEEFDTLQSLLDLSR
ncbi:rod shape-determining protein [Streptomyces fractus]|uniref:rod shape-determining protein n=1 Tax=Streptomyces fractus TaxID=641806 RepID=UPI003CE6DB04